MQRARSCRASSASRPGERGNLSSGYNWTIRPRPDTDGKYGRTEAINLETGAVLWKDRQRAPGTTCALATPGGVVFSGSLDRYLRAYDDIESQTFPTIVPEIQNPQEYASSIWVFGLPRATR